MTNKELCKKLSLLDEDLVVICQDDNGGWDNIQKVIATSSVIKICFGGGSPFSSDR